MQLGDELLHADLVHVLGDEIEKEEVSELLEVVEAGLAQNIVDLVPVDPARPRLYHGSPDPRPSQHAQPIQEEDAGDGSDNDEPEPEEDIQLLIDNVEGEDAESIVSLDSAGRSKLVKTALSNLREDNRQRVLPLLHLHLRELDHFQTVRRELIAEKPETKQI